MEGKLRSAVQDKVNVQSEKANIERQLKALQAQTGKLTKVPPEQSLKYKLFDYCLHWRCAGGYSAAVL